jgi:hypothetical protein
MDFGRDNYPLTHIQADRLRRCLPPGTPIDDLTRSEAQELLRLHDPNMPWRFEPASYRQLAFLRHRGIYRSGLTKGQAADLISELAKNGSGPK